MIPRDTDHRALPLMSSSLDVFLLGFVELDAVVELQERLHSEVLGRKDQHGTILICEHPPSVTIGREGSFADVLVDREELTARRIDIRWLNRGGGAFIHLPGQLSVYVVVPLERLQLGVLDYRKALEASVIDMASDLRIVSERATDVPGAKCRCGQFAFIGGAIREWVSSGGIHVNVSLPQESLDLVRWTHSEAKVTSMSAQRSRATAMSTVRESLVRHLASSLGYDSFHLFTGHPLLHRSYRKIYVYA